MTDRDSLSDRLFSGIAEALVGLRPYIAELESFSRRVRVSAMHRAYHRKRR